MEASQWVQPLIAVLISSLISTRAYRRKSLDFSGALSGFIVMSVHISLGYRFGAMLIVFFFSSSKLTKVGEEKKRRVDPEFKEGGQRNWLQVLSNSGIASILVVIVWKLTEGQDRCLNSKDSVLITYLVGGVIGHYCCCNGDTWSSELGILSDEQPRLITTFKVNICWSENHFLPGNFFSLALCNHSSVISKHTSIYMLAIHIIQTEATKGNKRYIKGIETKCCFKILSK